MRIHNVLTKPWSIAAIVAILILINVVSYKYYTRYDLTAEKRYTLSNTSKLILQNLTQPVQVQVLLKGQFPAGFKQLAVSTQEFLNDCVAYSKGKLSYTYTNPLEGLNAEDAAILKDSMQLFYDIPAVDINSLQKENNQASTITDVLPGALVTSNGKVMGVNLLRRAVLNLDDEAGTAALLNKIEASLESKFLDAISKASNTQLKTIGYATGNGEPTERDGIAIDAINTLAPKTEASAVYNFGYVDLKLTPYIPESIHTLIIAKPTIPFTEQDKLKIDQYIMRGGNVLWMVDNMYAELDSLMQSGSQGFVAYDRGLNIDDMLYKYGVRINQNLLQDLDADKLPLIKGDVSSGMQSQLATFSFMPLLHATNHPIVRNLDAVRAIFPNTLDTISGNTITKTILLRSSSHARIISTPYQVDFSFMEYANDMSKFTVKDTAVAVLLQGNFTSYFANRLSTSLADTLALYKRPLVTQAPTPGRMIVVADGDIALNLISQKGMPLLMGQNNYTGITYANKDFYLNAVAYLCHDDALLATRNKDYVVRILDPVKKVQDATHWKIMTTAIPLILIALFGLIYYYVKKRKYVV